MTKGKKTRDKNQMVGVLMFPQDAKTIPPSPLEAFPEHAKYIAYIVAEWSQIEYKLAMWTALRMSADKHVVMPMIYALETSRARLDVMAAVLRELVGDHPKVKGRLDKLLTEASQLLSLRVRYAHGHFGPDADSQELAIAGMGKRQAINIPLHELKHHFTRFKGLSHELAVIVATELGLPLGGPDAPDSAPTHPLGLYDGHARRAKQEPPQPSDEIQLPQASREPFGAHSIVQLPDSPPRSET
jgi:hypothetical protein